mgnify:CR=1 FL=1
MTSVKNHVPERTCIACRQTRSKRELIRLVQSTGGQVRIDEAGRETGRGAYLCRNRNCWELALKKDRKDRISRALKTVISSDNRQTLSEFGENFPSG